MLADRQLNGGGITPAHDRFDDEDVNRLRVALGRIARRVDRRTTGAGGLTRSQFSILATVARRETVGVRELAEIEGLNPTMLSRMLGKLEDAGLLTRSPDPDDKRVVRAHITEAGARTFADLRRMRTAVFTEHLAELSPDRLHALHDALPALEALAEQMCRRSAEERR